MKGYLQDEDIYEQMPALFILNDDKLLLIQAINNKLIQNLLYLHLLTILIIPSGSKQTLHLQTNPA